MSTRIKLHRRRRTKIIATLGPASSTIEVLARLFQGGADVFRLNFSHGTHEDHAARVLRKRGDGLETEVVVGGPLSDRKGVNVPDVVLPIPALTAKDHADLAFALDHGVNFIGLSFVQRP